MEIGNAKWHGTHRPRHQLYCRTRFRSPDMLVIFSNFKRIFYASFYPTSPFLYIYSSRCRLQSHQRTRHIAALPLPVCRTEQQQRGLRAGLHRFLHPRGPPVPLVSLRHCRCDQRTDHRITGDRFPAPPLPVTAPSPFCNTRKSGMITVEHVSLELL